MTQALQGLGLGLKEGTAEDSYRAHATVKPGSALLKPSEDLHPYNQDQNLALTPVKPSELLRSVALPLTAFSPLQPSGNTKSWSRAGGKRFQVRGNPWCHPIHSKGNREKHRLQPRELFPFNKEEEQGL